MNKLTLTLVFLRRDGQVLLAMKKRGFGVNRWNGVGGKIEMGETLDQALVRESREEIDVDPIHYEKSADIKFNEYFKGRPTIMHVHVYSCTKWEGEPTESEEMRPKWFDVDSVPYKDMWPDDPFWLPQVLAGDKIVANFTLDKNDKIISHEINTVKQL